MEFFQIELVLKETCCGRNTSIGALAYQLLRLHGNTNGVAMVSLNIGQSSRYLGLLGRCCSGFGGVGTSLNG